jgi:hypothetical protein
LAESLRDEVRELRAEVGACFETRERIELRFHALTRRTHELREALDELEALDPRGVPADRYDRYLELVGEFNAMIPEWEREADDLEGRAAACRALADDHNLKVDSLRRLLVDAGIWNEAWLDQGLPEADTTSPEQ